MMNETLNAIAQQINAKELKFAKFQLVSDGIKKVIVSKGVKAITIEYDEGSDTYNVRKFVRNNNFETVSDENLTNIYCDQLQEIISAHFKFEYVMHLFVRNGGAQ